MHTDVSDPSGAVWRPDADPLQRVTMRAACITGHGGNEVVAVGERPMPQRRPGEVLVRLRAATLNRVDLYMRDSGAGIAEELQPRVFDEFVQGHNLARQRDQGLGLGLAIVKHIVERHRGELDIDSTQGHGTTVTVRFPRPLGLSH